MSSKRFKIIALLGLVLSIALAGTAQAEQCSADGKICLVTDVSQPFVPPKTLEFKVASEATSFGVSGAGDASRLVQQGSPGGMSIWETPLGPAEQDGPKELTAYADGSGVESKASFTVDVRSAVADQRMTLRSTKQKVTVTYSYEARTSVLPVVQLYLNAFPKGKTIIVTLRGGKQPVTGPGSHTFSVSIPRKVIKNKCKQYGGCFVLGWGRSWISEPGLPERSLEADVGTYSPRKKVYTRPARKNTRADRTPKVGKR